MLNNSFEKWIGSDKNLQNLITEIESKNLSIAEKAALGFEKLCELYQIPRMPSDVKNEEDNEKATEMFTRSLFEEHAYIRFLSDGSDDPRGLVLSAVFHLLNDLQIDLKNVVKKEFRKKIPSQCMVALRGDGYYGEVVFPEKEGKSWVELGCNQMTLVTI